MVSDMGQREGQTLTACYTIGTINELQTRKQHYKLTMFRRLYYILIATTGFILVFFVWSSLQFSNRLAEGALIR